MVQAKWTVVVAVGFDVGVAVQVAVVKMAEVGVVRWRWAEVEAYAVGDVVLAPPQTVSVAEGEVYAPVWTYALPNLALLESARRLYLGARPCAHHGNIVQADLAFLELRFLAQGRRHLKRAQIIL